MVNPRDAFEHAYGRSERPPIDDAGAEQSRSLPPPHPALWSWARYVGRMLALLVSAAVLWLGAAFGLEGGPGVLIGTLFPGLLCLALTAFIWVWDGWMSLNHPGVILALGVPPLALVVSGLCWLVLTNLPNTHPAGLVAVNLAFLGLLLLLLGWQARVAWQQRRTEAAGGT